MLHTSSTIESPCKSEIKTRKISLIKDLEKCTGSEPLGGERRRGREKERKREREWEREREGGRERRRVSES